MTTAHEHASDLLHDAACRDNQHDGPEAEWPCNTLAAEVLAAEARTRTVKSARALANLPVGTVVLSASGTIACRVEDHPDHARGVVFGDERTFPWNLLSLPVTVLHHPKQDRA